MSPQNHCYCLERAASSSSPLTLFVIEEILREEGLNSTVILAVLDAFRSLIERAEDAEALVELEGVNYGDVVLTFGKHNGKMLKEVDPGYLLWVLDNVKPERINKYTLLAIKRFLRDEKYRN
jgi:hypothetical protein